MLQGTSMGRVSRSRVASDVAAAAAARWILATTAPQVDTGRHRLQPTI
jgi:hypothetical protein